MNQTKPTKISYNILQCSIYNLDYRLRTPKSLAFRFDQQVTSQNLAQKGTENNETNLAPKFDNAPQ